MKTSPILPTPFLQMLSILPPTSLSPPNPTTTALSVVIFLWLNGWSCHIWCAILLNDNMDLHMSNLCTNLLPERPWCMFYATRHQIYRDLTHNVVFYWYSDLIWHTHTHTHTRTHTHTKTHKHTLTHPNKYIFTPSATCSQQLPLPH